MHKTKSRKRRTCSFVFTSLRGPFIVLPFCSFVGSRSGASLPITHSYGIFSTFLSGCFQPIVALAESRTNNCRDPHTAQTRLQQIGVCSCLPMMGHFLQCSLHLPRSESVFRKMPLFQRNLTNPAQVRTRSVVGSYTFVLITELLVWP